MGAGLVVFTCSSDIFTTGDLLIAKRQVELLGLWVGVDGL